jgi:hypothetical protein
MQDLAKTFYVTFNNAKDAAFMYQLAGHDPFDVQEVDYHYHTTTLPAVMAKPWKQLIASRLERRLNWLENKRDDVMRQYSVTVPYKARKALYEQKMPVLDELIKKTKEQLRKEPDVRWSPCEVDSLKRLGVETYLSYYVDRFYPTAT